MLSPKVFTFIALSVLIFSAPALAHESSSENLESFTNLYNSVYEKASSALKTLVGTETIKITYKLADGDTIIFGAKTVDGKITESSPVPFASSTLAVSLSEETLNKIANSADPLAEFKNAWGGEIKVEGLTFTNIIKIFIVNVIKIFTSFFSPAPASQQPNFGIQGPVRIIGEPGYPYYNPAQYGGIYKQQYFAASEDIGKCGTVWNYAVLEGMSVVIKQKDGTFCKEYPVNLCTKVYDPKPPTANVFHGQPFYYIKENLPIGKYLFSLNLPEGWGYSNDPSFDPKKVYASRYPREMAVSKQSYTGPTPTTEPFYITKGAPTPARISCDGGTTSTQTPASTTTTMPPTTTTIPATTTTSLESCSDKVTFMNSKLPVAASSSSAVWDGKNAYIFWKSDIYKYEPATDQIQTIYNSITPSDRRATSAIYDGSFAFAFGGEAGKDGTFDFRTLEDISKYDPKNNIFTKQNSKLNPPLGLTSAIWDGQNAYIFGGFNSSGGSSIDILKYDTRTDILNKMAAKLPEPLQTTAAAWDGKNAYIFGGHSQPVGDSMNDEIYRYDPSTDTIVKMSSKLPNAMQAMLAASDGKYIYIFGGTDNNKKFDTILKYDPTADKITTMSTKLPSTLYMGSVIYDGKNFFIFGGVDSGVSDKIIKYCPPSDGTTTTTSTPIPDLEITAADISDATFDSTINNYTFSLTIRNIGNANSGRFNTSLVFYNQTHVFGYHPSDAIRYTDNISPGGQNKTTLVMYIFSLGKHPIVENFMLNVSIDSQNQVSESNENNNFVSKNVSVVTTPTTTTTSTTITDLCGDAFVMAYNSTSGECNSFPVNCVPSGWTVGCPGPTTTSAGLPDLTAKSSGNFQGSFFSTYLNFSVTNSGTANAGAFDVNVTVQNWTTQYNPSGIWYTGKTRINSLAAGATTYISFNVTNATYCVGYNYCYIPNGATVNGHGRNSYYVNITADYLNEVSESNENNNKNSTFIHWNTTNTVLNSALVTAQLLQFIGSTSYPTG